MNKLKPSWGRTFLLSGNFNFGCLNKSTVFTEETLAKVKLGTSSLSNRLVRHETISAYLFLLPFLLFFIMSVADDASSLNSSFPFAFTSTVRSPFATSPNLRDIRFMFP